jgi:hypothetical protein
MADPHTTTTLPRVAIPDVIDQFRSYVEKPGNGEWGSLHIVLADGNVDDIDVQFCIDHAREIGDSDGERLAVILLGMTKTQRRKLPYAI